MKFFELSNSETNVQDNKILFSDDEIEQIITKCKFG